MATQPNIEVVEPAVPASSCSGEERMLEQYRRHVEREVLAAKDERTRFIRLVILAATEAAQQQLKARV